MNGEPQHHHHDYTDELLLGAAIGVLAARSSFVRAVLNLVALVFLGFFLYAVLYAIWPGRPGSFFGPPRCHISEVASDKVGAYGETLYEDVALNQRNEPCPPDGVVTDDYTMTD